MNISRFIKKIILKFNIIPLLLNFNFYKLSAYLIIFISEKLINNSKISVLCLGRHIFNEDILALSKYSGKINYFIIPKETIINFFFSRLENKIKPYVHTNYYKILSEKLDDNKTQILIFNYKVIKLIQQILTIKKFDAVMSGNYNYAWQQQIASYCLGNNIKFIVLNKEGLFFKDDVIKSLKNYTNNKFIGSIMLVINNFVQKAFLDKHLIIENLNKSKIKVVGIPRLDNYFLCKKQNLYISFFSFFITDKFEFISLTDKEIEFYKSESDRIHKEVFSFASKDPKIKLVIKTKQGKKYLDYVNEVFKKYNIKKSPNILITDNLSTNDIILNSSAVIGFNSTVLLEALLCDKLVITTKFEGVLNNIFSDYKNVVRYFSNKLELETILKKPNFYQNLSQKKKLLVDYLGVDNGTSSKITEKIIIDLVQK